MAKRSSVFGGVFKANTRTASTRLGEITYVKHDEFIGRSLSIYGEWAQLEIDHLLNYIAPGDLVIDIGANVGFHALSFARKAGKSGLVWAFEPDPVNGLLLRHNIIQAGYEENVIPFDVAVSDAVRVCQFRTHPISARENFGHTAIDPEAGSYPRISLPLDVLGFSRAPTLIKIDIEGHELTALGGMVELIQEFLPVVSVEAETPEEIEVNGAALASMGYDVYSLVVDAYNSGNFAGNPTDIWKGHGRCSNLLCVVPGKHRPPAGLSRVRRAVIARQEVLQLGKTIGGVYSAIPAQEGQIGNGQLVSDMGAVRADVRKFVSSFLRTTYGKLDPVSHADLVESALDFLAASGAPGEGAALQRLLIAGVESFAEALGDRAKLDELAKAKADREALLAEAERLKSELEQGAAARQSLEEEYQRIAEDQMSRLRASEAAESRLNAELSKQAALARRQIEEALASVAATEKHTEDLEAQRDRLSDELAELRDRLEQASAQQERMIAETAALQKAAAQDRALFEKKLKASADRGDQATKDLAKLEKDNKRLTTALSEKEGERNQLSSELAEAQERLALQAQQLRHLRSVSN